MTRRLLPIALGVLPILALAACDPRFDLAAGSPPRTAADWLDDRELAAVAHCPPPPLVGEREACQHLAWDYRRS